MKTDLGSRIVRAWAIVPAAVNEREVAEDLLEAGPAPRDLLADKGFSGRAFAAAQAARGTAVLVPPEKKQRASMPPVLQKVIAEWRDRIETAFSEITDRMKLARHGAHSFGASSPAPQRPSPHIPCYSPASPRREPTHITRLRLTTKRRRKLQQILAAATSPQRLVLRARIVLAAASEKTNARIARELGCSVAVVRTWRGRFAVRGIPGLFDRRRSGRPEVHGPSARLGPRGRHLRPARGRVTVVAGHHRLRHLGERGLAISPTTVGRDAGDRSQFHDGTGDRVSPLPRRESGPTESPKTRPGAAAAFSVVCSSHELLPTVDVVGCAGERGVGHDVDGERGDVGGVDDAADREGGPQLIAAFLELVSEQRCRQGGVDEAGGDEVDANRRELKREGRGERGQRGGGGGGDPEAVTNTPAAGAAHEQQRASRPHLAGGVARNLERQHHVLAEGLAHLG